MSKKKDQPVTKLTGEDRFIFGDKVSSMNASQFTVEERDLEKEIFSKKGIAEQVDQFEQEMGIARKTSMPENIRYKTALFSMNNDEDRALFNQLLNDKEKYRIFWFEKNWTVHGDFKIFVVYIDNLDAKKKDVNEGEEETI